MLLLFSFCPAACESSYQSSVENEVVEWKWKWQWRRVIVAGVACARGGEGAVGRQGAMSKRQQIFCSTATASRPHSAKCETVSNWAPPPPPAAPLPSSLPQPGGGDGSVHSSVQLGENKWFNKRLEVCNHLNFTSFVLFMISVHNFLPAQPSP